MTGPLPLARQLGEKLGSDPIPEVQPINQNVWRFRRQDLWPAEVWEEMQRIWNDE